MYALTGIGRVRAGREVLALGSLALGQGGVTALLGHNGSGKSTLMNLLARADRPDRGQITLDGRPLGSFSQKALARRVAYLPQRPPAVPGLTVAELVALGRYPWRGPLAPLRAPDRARIEAAMAATDCAHLAPALAEHLSGGERQRAFIAMALAQEAPLLLLDEPTSALDLAHAHEVMALLRRLADQGGRAVVVVLHDVNLATRFADRIVALKGGQLAFDGPPADLLQPARLSALYDIPMQVLPVAGRLPEAVVA